MAVLIWRVMLIVHRSLSFMRSVDECSNGVVPNVIQSLLLCVCK